MKSPARLPFFFLLLLGSALSGSGCASTALDLGGEGRYELCVLGIAQDGGLPHLGCTKACCVEARASGRVLYPACLGIVDHETGRLALVEATPAVEAQVALLHGLGGGAQRERRPVDAILITHAHIGHYTGLIHFGREVASTKSVPTWVTERMAHYLTTNGPWSQLVKLEQIEPRVIAPGIEFEPLPGLKVTPVAVPHRDEFSDTVAFKLRGSHRTVLFVPDVDRISDSLMHELLDGVDVAYIDATFYDGRELPGRDLSEIPHPPMVKTMERLAYRAQEQPGSIRFIHLNHTNPALHDGTIQSQIRRRGFAVAQRGEKLKF